MTVRIICVDFQKDFTEARGVCYQVRPCVAFIRKYVVPYCKTQGIRIAEIVSDYRAPRPGVSFTHCEPGSPGYESGLPLEVKHPLIWVKCMHSPLWVREHGGVAGETPGLPYQDPAAFSQWLTTVVGEPGANDPIILIGLTLDCCIICTALELFFRGYKVEFLTEGVDAYSGSREEKRSLLHSPLANWGRPVSWQEVRERNSP